ncbi:MAG: glycosyltransferase family 4 protein [Planctomycetaceae bacterium]
MTHNSDTIRPELQADGRPFVLHTRVVTGTGGGPEKTILNSPRFLARYGIDSACLFMRPPHDPGFATLEAKAATAQAEIIGVDDTGPFDRNVVRECVRICRERKVDIWHAHDYKSNALGLLVRRFHRMHLVTTAHGWVRFTARTPLYYWVDRFSMKRFDHVICVSQDLYDRCRSIRIPEQRLTLIDNAIVASDYDPSPATPEERRHFGFHNGQVLLGACGRLSEEKGFHLLINAVDRMVRSGLNVGLIIAGEGHLKEQLERQIAERNLQDRVKLAGFLEDPRTLYRAIDIFVLSSLREGLPNVVLEAMASRRAVVTTNVNGIPRLVIDGQNGMVVACDNEDHLYRGIKSCLEHPGRTASLAAGGRRTVEEAFSFERRMQKMVDVYRGLPGMSQRLTPGTESDMQNGQQ